MTNKLARKTHAPVIPARPMRPLLMGMSPFQSLFEEFFDNPFPVIKASTDGFPVTDLYWNDDGNQVIEMALAGYDLDNLNIEVKDNSITIRCDSQVSEGDGKNYRRIAKRAFSKTFVDYDGKLDLTAAKATFNNGLLSVVLPKIPEKQPHIIKIEESTKSEIPQMEVVSESTVSKE